jgi:hypothetical protein
VLEFRVEFVGIIDKINGNLRGVGGVCAGAPEGGGSCNGSEGPLETRVLGHDAALGGTGKLSPCFGASRSKLPHKV